jgi:hypothetical protein
MASFTDKAGRVWKLDIPEAAARTLLDEGVSVFKDPYKRFGLLWAIVESQAARFDIDIAAFDELVSDEATFAEANKALHLAIESFSLKLLSVDVHDIAAKSIAYRRFMEGTVYGLNNNYCHIERLGEGFSAIVIFARSSRHARLANLIVDQLMSRGLRLAGFGNYECVMVCIVSTESITARMRRRLVRLSRKLGAAG